VVVMGGRREGEKSGMKGRERACGGRGGCDGVKQEGCVVERVRGRGL